MGLAEDFLLQSQVWDPTRNPWPELPESAPS